MGEAGEGRGKGGQGWRLLRSGGRWEAETEGERRSKADRGGGQAREDVSSC